MIEREPLQAKPISQLKSPDAEVVRIPALAFLRAMGMIAWSSIRHPFSTTVIDLTTGRIVQ